MMYLKMRKGDTIYRKIIFLIGASTLVFSGLLFSVFYYTIQQEKEVYKNALGDFDNEVDAVLELEAQTNMSNIIDMVHWDDFVDYLQTRDQSWFEDNITSSVETYRSDYLGIYDVSGNFIGRSSTAKIKSEDIIPKGVFKELQEKRMMHFYIKIPEGYAQVYGATVHPTKDIYTKNGQHYGFFFIVKLIDDDYFAPIEKLNNSEIDIASLPAPTCKSIAVARHLKDWTGAPIASIVFKRSFDVSFGTTKSILLILIITYFLNVLVYLIYARLLVHKPLRIITKLLESGKSPDMDSLNRIPSEFRYIGTMFQENDNQRQLLEVAKAKAEESDRLKSSFLTNISHEIRTPMNAIAGFSNLLLAGGLSEAQRIEYAKIINKSGSNLISIIDDLIEMSRIDSNQIAPNFSDVDIDALMAELYKTINITIPEHKKLDFKVLTAVNGLTGNIIIDEVKLKQILTNLITNAIKYTDKGFVTFGYVINTRKMEIEFTIRDSGIGIDASQQSKIFDRFHRIENDYTIIAGGLGLGLAISKAYISMLGGRIWVQSEENIGTTFSFTIPLQYSVQENKKTKAPVFVEKSTPATAITILVAEDDNINFLLMQKMLNTSHHVLVRAKNGQEAVDLCLHNPDFDLVLMDIKMPVMDGFRAYEIIKILRPSLPIIAQTAFASSDDELKMRSLGFHGYISKPIKKERLFEIIDEVMELKVKV